MFSILILAGIFIINFPFLIGRVKMFLHMLQLNSYMYNRYLLWGRRSLSKVFRIYDLIFIITILILSRFMRYEIIYIIWGLGSIIRYATIKQQQAKKKLVITARVKRLIVSVSAIFILILLVAYNFKTSLINLLIYFELTQLTAFFIVLLGNIVILPIEKAIQYYYYTDAYKKIRSMSNLRVVGITGSYGKTSTKNIIYKILSQKYNVLMTPESYNTTMGNVVTIRKELTPLHDIFISEMGAKKTGDIKAICELVAPQYGVVTSIGPQHLETFGRLENVINTKYELINCLPSNGLGIINFDDQNVVKGFNLNQEKNTSYITYGLNSAVLGIRAKEVKYTENGTTFIVEYNNCEYEFSTKLLGKHNIYNILAGIALGFNMGMDYKSIFAGVKEITPIEHRLQIKRKNGYIIIDDAYNSNPMGAEMALEVLDTIPGNKKILVTPGMIELGQEQYNLNKEFGKYAAQVCDYIILVGEKQTKPIQDALLEAKYPPNRFYIAKSIFDAFNHIELIREIDDVILLENDLPDDYNE